MKIGDRVKILGNKTESSGSAKSYHGQEFIITGFGMYNNRSTVIFENGEKVVYFDEVEELTQGVYPMLKTVTADLKVFIAEHKSTIYMIAALFLVDHLFFQGAFRQRLQGLMSKMLGKVEAQIDGVKASAAPVSLVAETKS